MRKRNGAVYLLFAMMMACLLSACSGGGGAAIPVASQGEGGRCVQNDDCRQGFRCDEGFCVDIYHPRSEVYSR